MTQAFGVRLIDCGPNRLAVLRRVRPLLGLTPAEAKAAINVDQPIQIALDISRDAAHALAAELDRLGAKYEIFVSIDDECAPSATRS